MSAGQKENNKNMNSNKNHISSHKGKNPRKERKLSEYEKETLQKIQEIEDVFFTIDSSSMDFMLYEKIQIINEKRYVYQGDTLDQIQYIINGVKSIDNTRDVIERDNKLDRLCKTVEKIDREGQEYIEELDTLSDEIREINESW